MNQVRILKIMCDRVFYIDMLFICIHVKLITESTKIKIWNTHYDFKHSDIIKKCILPSMGLISKLFNVSLWNFYHSETLKDENF